MGRPSGARSMKWTSFVKDIREKVGLSPRNPSSSSSSRPPFSDAPTLPSAAAGSDDAYASALAEYEHGPPPCTRGRHELEIDFKKCWQISLSSHSEKEKEMALNMAIDFFCTLAKQVDAAAHLVTTLVETHLFTFAIGRAFVTNIEKLRIHNMNKTLHVSDIVNFFSETTKSKILCAGDIANFFFELTKDGISTGSNLLYIVEVLVSGPFDNQPLLDSGILSCLVHILKALLYPGEDNQTKFSINTRSLVDNLQKEDTANQMNLLEVEGSIVHIMKTLSSNPSATHYLIDDDSLQLLFQLVATGSSTVFSQFKHGLVPLHTIRLQRHTLQILSILLINSNGTVAQYLYDRHLVKVLLLAVKDFNPEDDDAAYTIGIVDLLVECIELSHRPGPGRINLRDDIHNAHGYQFLVQLALKLSVSHQKQASLSTKEYSAEICSSDSPDVAQKDTMERADHPPVSPALSKLLDVFVSLALIGPLDSTGSSGGTDLSCKSAVAKEGYWEKGNTKVQDLEAIQMLQDIFLKSDYVEVQAEVLNKMFKIFSSHLDNYALCQQLRIVPLFILNMAHFSESLQEMILNFLEFSVTVVNCVPEQELLSLCCLLQQSITTSLRSSVLSFFLKLLSFDHRYKKVLWEVGFLDFLIDDLLHHKLISSSEQTKNLSEIQREFSSNSFKKQFGIGDAILSSPRSNIPGSRVLSVFEDDGTISIAWNCLQTLLRKCDVSQQSFRSNNGFTIIIPFLASDVHRTGVLRILSCLIIEDTMQIHPEELSMMIEVLKSGMVTNVFGLQYNISNDAKCDIFVALWRILGANASSQMVFGEATGFSLLLTTLHSFHSNGEKADSESSLPENMQVFSHLLHVMTLAVCNNANNRLRLHTILSSHTFCDLLYESTLICVVWEEQVIRLLLELALEKVYPPAVLQTRDALSSDPSGHLSANIQSTPYFGISQPDEGRIYNPSAIAVLIRSLLQFTPTLQLELLILIERLSLASPFNQENLTCVGCVGLILDAVGPFLSSSSPLLIHALKIVEVLGAYKLYTSELRVLVRYILQMKAVNSGHYLVDMMEKLIQMEETISQYTPLAPFVEMDMRNTGHASIQVSLGERTWPPAAGYTFVCWFQYHGFLKSSFNVIEQQSETCSITKNVSNSSLVLRIFSVGAADNSNTFFMELFIQDSQLLVLTTGNSFSISFPELGLEEGKWNHLAVVHNKPNALAGLFQASAAHFYINGRLRHTGKIGYSPSPEGKLLQVIIGTPLSHAKVSSLSWKLRSCYLFEEVLTPGSIFFMYILGRGYRGMFQDTNLLRFVPNHACGGNNMAILDSLDTELTFLNMQRIEGSSKQVDKIPHGNGINWDFSRLENISFQLNGKKLIFAFDGTSSETSRASGLPSLLNLVDPTSAVASSVGGIPRFGHLYGDSYICCQSTIGDNIRSVGGIAVVLALVEASETRDMLHMALTLLAAALHQNPQNLVDMHSCRGYHLLAIFLHRRMSLFDMQSLDVFFQIAACEAIIPGLPKLQGADINPFPIRTAISSVEDASLQKSYDENLSAVSRVDFDDIAGQKDSFGYFSEFESSFMSTMSSNCLVLSNADMVEHVLLDWTLWVTAPVSIQLAVLAFFEQLVSTQQYRIHNLTLLRQINFVYYLLLALQRDDMEVRVLERLVVLLGVVLEDGFLGSELDAITKFVIMSFDTSEQRKSEFSEDIIRETVGKHVIVRNLLLEMIVDLRLTITLEAMLEQWHNVVSLKFIMLILCESIHPTSMKWIITLLGVCLSSSPAFCLEFHASGGYQVLARVLPCFNDSLDVYYILFCLILGKDVYPIEKEIILDDLNALISCDGCHEEFNFVEILDSVISMAKFAFDRLSLQNTPTERTGSLIEESNNNNNNKEDYAAEAAIHMRSARHLNVTDGAPAIAASVLRFMVDLTKVVPSFSVICRQREFLESCVDLYFSCASAYCVMRNGDGCATGAQEMKGLSSTNCNLNNYSDVFSSHELQQRPAETSMSNINVFPLLDGVTPEETFEGSGLQSPLFEGNEEREKGRQSLSHSATHSFQTEYLEQKPVISYETNKVKIADSNVILSQKSINSSNSTLLAPPDPSDVTRKIVSTSASGPNSSPILVLASWLGSRGNNQAKQHLASTSIRMSMGSLNRESDESLQQSTVIPSALVLIQPSDLVEIDDKGYVGGYCTGGATAILDFASLVLSDIILEKLKSSQYVESILEAIPLFINADSALAFQGLCLGKLMNSLERQILQDDGEEKKKLDQNIVSVNLGALCWLIVDRVYMGAFPKPAGILRTLEFLLSMLQLANKDGYIEKTVPSGKGLLSLTRGSRQLGTYIHAVLKSSNRMIMYCFLPSFLSSINENDFLSCLGFQTAPGKTLLMMPSAVESFDICAVLQLILDHKHILLCPNNLDTDLICCLCVNLISLVKDQRLNARVLALDIIKYLLLHRRSTIEDLLASKPHQGQNLDVLHGGFDKLLTEGASSFFKWFHRSEHTVSIVLDQCASLMWGQYISGSAKFLGVRIKGMENRSLREMDRKSQDVVKLNLRHQNHTNEQRDALRFIRESMHTELRVIRQNKYGWILHAENEWQTHIQQLVHERGIIPINSSLLEQEWQLCGIEGPYRMRKKLERCKLKVETIENFLIGGLDLKENKTQKKDTIGSNNSEFGSETFFNFLSDSVDRNTIDSVDMEDSFFEADDNKEEESISSQRYWNGDQDSTASEVSLHSAQFSVAISDSVNANSEMGSPLHSSPIKIDQMSGIVGKSEKRIHNNGEYLIRPYLEPFEKIQFMYNCERVVGLDKHDGIFLIGDSCLYVIENFYINDFGCICEKQNEDELSVIDQALGMNKDATGSSDVQSKETSTCSTPRKAFVCGRAWTSSGSAWGKKRVQGGGNISHSWHMWKVENINELLKRDYQLRPVAVEIFSADGCNELLVFHKKERDEVFKNLMSINLPRKIMLDETISGMSKQDSNEGSRLFKNMTKSFSKRWQNGEISNFQYLMHLNTLAGRGYSDLTQYPVFPWVLADYESDNLNLKSPETFRKLDKPMGCQTAEGEEEFRKRYENWDDPDVPKFHYGSHYSSAGIVLFYLVRLPPFSTESQKLQGGQFDRADRLFNSIRETWLSAVGNTSDVKEVIPEFFYMPEFLENRFKFDLGVKQSGEKIDNVVLPPWAKGSAREFINKHREALECDYVSENLHHWIDLIFGYKQRGEAAEEAVNVFYHYTYEGSVDIDSISDPALKASILAQINHFGQTPKQLFLKPHVKRRSDKKIPFHPLRYYAHLSPHEVQRSSSTVSQIVSFHDKILIAGLNSLLKPVEYSEYVAWGFPDCSLRFMSYDQNKIISIHEQLHGGRQIVCAGITHDGHILVTGADDGSLAVWIVNKSGFRAHQNLSLQQALCAHTAKITCIYVSQPYSLIVTGSEDCTVILWDLRNLAFVKQLPNFPAPVSAIHVNDLNGEILTAAGILLAIWSVNGDCLAAVDTSQLPSDLILSVSTSLFSDWQDTNWFVTGHKSGAIKIWTMVYITTHESNGNSESYSFCTSDFNFGSNLPEYRLALRKVLKFHKHPVTAFHLKSDLKQLLSGDSSGRLVSWTLPVEI